MSIVISKNVISKIKDELEAMISRITTLEQTLETLKKQHIELINKSNKLQSEINDSLKEDEVTKKRDEATNIVKETAILMEKANQLEKEKEILSEKAFILIKDLNFQIEILKIWENEKYYRTLLDEQGLTTAQALLQKQGYVLSRGDDVHLVLSSAAKDYLRIHRQDIADLLNDLSDFAKQDSVFEKAKASYDKAPDYNYGFVLSMCYFYGLGTEVNKKLCFEINKRFADENHPLALWALANEYFRGDLIERDLKKAVECFEKATLPKQQDFYLPHYFWGFRLIQGNDVDKDIINGLRLLQIASEKDIDLAIIGLATYFCNYLQKPPASASEVDMKHAQEQCYFYARKGNDSNLPLSKLFLSQCYARGWGVTPDLQQFFTLISQCVTLGVDQAFAPLAAVYRFGIEGIIEPNPIQALKLFFEGLRKRYSPNNFNLRCFKAFLTQNQNNPDFMHTAYEQCRKCLEGHLLDNALDSNLIGAFYLNEVLVPFDPEKAIECFQKAADLGQSTSAKILILLSIKGNSLGLLPPSIIEKYLPLTFNSEEDNDHEFSQAREYYRTNFIPLFKAVNESWPMIGQESKGISGGVTKLIVDYAYEPLNKVRV